MSNLSQFYNVINEVGVSKDYLGKVSILDFSHLEKNLILKPEHLIYVKDFTLPGIKVEETSIKMQGNIIKDPGNTTYNDRDITITFYTDQFYILRKFFELVIKNQSLFPNKIEQNKNKSNIVLSVFAEDGFAPANLEPNSNTDFENFSDEASFIFKFFIKGAFLKGIDQVTYNTAGTGNVQELKLVFAYTDYETESSIYLDKVSGKKYSYEKRAPVTSANTNENGAGAGQGSAPKTNVLGSIIKGLNNIGQVARAFGGAAQAVGGAARAVGGATTEVRNTRRVIRNR